MLWVGKVGGKLALVKTSSIHIAVSKKAYRKYFYFNRLSGCLYYCLRNNSVKCQCRM